MSRMSRMRRSSCHMSVTDTSLWKLNGAVYYMDVPLLRKVTDSSFSVCQQAKTTMTNENNPGYYISGKCVSEEWETHITLLLPKWWTPLPVKFTNGDNWNDGNTRQTATMCCDIRLSNSCMLITFTLYGTVPNGHHFKQMSKLCHPKLLSREGPAVNFNSAWDDFVNTCEAAARMELDHLLNMESGSLPMELQQKILREYLLARPNWSGGRMYTLLFHVHYWVYKSGAAHWAVSRLARVLTRGGLTAESVVHAVEYGLAIPLDLDPGPEWARVDKNGGKNNYYVHRLVHEFIQTCSIPIINVYVNGPLLPIYFEPE